MTKLGFEPTSTLDSRAMVELFYMFQIVPLFGIFSPEELSTAYLVTEMGFELCCLVMPEASNEPIFINERNHKNHLSEPKRRADNFL